MRTNIESVGFKVPDVRTQLFDGAKVPTPQNMFLENPQRHGIRNLLEIKTLGDPPTTSVNSTHIKSDKNVLGHIARHHQPCSGQGTFA